MRAKKNLNYDAKLHVARRACDYIEDGECVYLDGGTSIAVMAEFLEKRPIQIFTHSELLVRSMNTVSYTHLDVYKRQSLSTADTTVRYF